MDTWLYDDYTWWVCAIHSAVCPAAHSIQGSKTLEANIPTFSEYEECYTQALARLRCSDVSEDSARRILFAAKALRKWRLADRSTSSERQRAAIEGFLKRNGSSHLLTEIPYPYSFWMREILKEWLPRPNFDRQTEPKGRFGPGACAEHWTHCERMTRLSKWVAQSQHWPEVVEPNVSDASHIRARLCAVPKTATKDRLITVEPAYATFAQQYVREYILESIHQGSLRWSAMDLGYTDGQAQQRRLAVRGSKNKRLATLDLKDASDRIGWLHIQQVFPPHVLSLLETCRSSEIEVQVAKHHPARERRVSPLQIYAGMGNATTFAVETLFFAAFVYAYARAHGLPTFVSVFGDDIICTSQWAEAFMKDPEHDCLGFFVVGPDKSFWGADKLRESCGIFAYQGVDITVPKVDGYPNTWDGRLSLCELHDRLASDRSVWARKLAYSIAARRQVVNWPIVIEGYPSIHNSVLASTEGYDTLPVTRQNRELQRKEAWVPIRHPCYQSYKLDWRSAKRFNHPPPEDFLQAVLLGQAGSSQQSLRRLCPVRGCTSIRFPIEGSYHVSHAWRPVRPPRIP